MKILFFVLCFSLLFCNSYSQSGWVRVTDSIPNFTIGKIQFTSSNTGFAVGWYNNYLKGGFLKTTNAGTNWIRKDSVSASIFKVKFFNVNTGIVTYKYSYARKTTDGGDTWADLSGMNWMEPSYMCCLDANNWLVANGSSNYINKTTNGGLNWTPINMGNIFYTLCFVNGTTGYTSTYGSSYPYHDIYKSTNSGYNWFKIDSINNFSAQSGCLYFVNENTGFICGYGANSGIYKTTNAGVTWTLQNLIKNRHWLTLSFINANTGYVGGDDGFIYKTTTGGSVFVKNISNEVPDKFSLSQNYPNPFNPSTNIRYQLHTNSNVKLIVYDALGKEIETLVNENQPEGIYEVTFDGSKYPSGVYFYKISAEDFNDTKRMVLIK